MREKAVSLEKAAELVTPGCTLGIGGIATKRKPMAFIREITKRRIEGIVPYSLSSSLDMDLLIGTGCASAVNASYVGFEQLGMAPNFTRFAREGRIQVNEYSEWIFVMGLRASVIGLPFYPTKAAFGSDLVTMRGLKTVKCPYTGEEVLAIPAIPLDVAVIHAISADVYGNVHATEAPDFLSEGDYVLAKAAKRLIVTVEKVLTPEESRKISTRTVIFNWEVDAVVEVPGGAHATGFAPNYEPDINHLSRYLEMANTEEGFAEYLAKYVDGPDSFESYLNLVSEEK